jgi:hypothetical protein
MDEFEIEIGDGDNRAQYPARLLIMGYTHKIEVDVNGIPVMFEPDEERNYRAVVANEHRDQLNVQLLKQLADAIEAVVK